MGKWIYYMRVSTKQQKMDRQEYNEEFTKFCKRNNINVNDVIELHDIKTGKNFDRPNYQLMKKVVSPGDNIIVSSIDRFGRNYIEGRKEFTAFISKGIKVYVLNRPMLEDLYKLDDSMSKFMINFLIDWELINAEEELKRIRQRQKEGIDAAKKKNVKFGRPKIEMPDDFIIVYYQWKSGKITAKNAMQQLQLKRNTFYNFVKEIECDEKAGRNLNEQRMD